MKRFALLISASLVAAFPLAALGEQHGKGAAPGGEGSRAEAVLKPTKGNQATGTVTFQETAQGVRIVAELKNLSPGKHGFHVHEKGDCSAPDAESAGGHFASGGHPHGAPENPPDKRHAGDMGNIEAGKDGRARYERVDTVMRLRGQDSIVGRAVVVHAGPDDLTSQPSGNSGPRVACGVIEAVRK